MPFYLIFTRQVPINNIVDLINYFLAAIFSCLIGYLYPDDTQVEHLRPFLTVVLQTFIFVVFVNFDKLIFLPRFSANEPYWFACIS